MLRSIVGSSLQLRFLVVILAAALMFFGIAQLRTMPVDVLPEFDPPLVEVQTEALGLSAAEVESLITVPMEADLLNGVAWLDQIYSESVAGLSSILLVFEPGTDPIKARQMVQERLTQAHALPNVSTPPVMLQPLSATSRVMIVGLSSKDMSLIEMGVLARWNIKSRLMGVPGVANVAIWGQRERQLQVQVDPARLQAAGVSLEQVIETTGDALWVSPLSYLEASKPGTAGWIDTPNQRLGIRHSLPIQSPEDLARVTVSDSDGLLLGDVATVVEDHQPLIGDAALRDGPGLLLVIQKFPNANTLEVTRGIEEALNAMRPGLTGIEIDTAIFRPAGYIEQSIGNLSFALLIGAILIVLTLSALFFGWRTALISLVAIPLALVAASFVLYLMGASFNILVLAGLMMALAVVIDDAVVGVENIARRLRQRREVDPDISSATIIHEATIEIRSHAMYATLILLLAVAPVFFIEGLTGSLFRPLALSYTLAILASLTVALLVTPALGLILYPNGKHDRRTSPLLQGIQESYRGLLSRTVRATYPALAISVALILGGLALVPLLWQQSLLPSFKQPDLLIQWEGAPGTSAPAMNRITAQVRKELLAIPGVRNVGSHVGRAITGDEVVGINSGELWVSLQPTADYRATVAAIQDVINGYPGLFRTVQTYLPKRLNEALNGGAQPVVVRLYGNDLSILHEKATEIQHMLAGIDGIVDAQAQIQAEEPQIEIQVDLAAAQLNRIKPGDIRRTATTLLSGLYVGNLFEDQKVFDVVVLGVPELRNSLSDIRNLQIDTPEGQVRLADVADVRIVPAPTHIKRDAVSRYVDISANVSGRSLGSVVDDVERHLQTISFPMEFHAELLGESVAHEAAEQRMLIVIGAALIGMFLLIQAALSSWRLALVTFVAIPVALVGGLLAAFLGGGLSLGALFGLAAVLGLAVRNAVMMLRHFQQLERYEGESFGIDLVLRGAGERLIPIVITSLATSVALVPIVVFGSIPGLEIIYPMAIVVLGGLVTSLLLNLFVIPSIYLHFGTSPEPVWTGQPAAAFGRSSD